MTEGELRIDDIRFYLRLDADASGQPSTLYVEYTPWSEGMSIGYLEGDLSLRRDRAPELWPRLDAFKSVFDTYAPGGLVSFGGERAPLRSTVFRIEAWEVEESVRLSVKVRQTTFTVDVERNRLSAAQKDLVDSVFQSVRRLAWEDIRSGMGAMPRGRKAAFISYRKVPEYEQFAESVAQRLQQEGLTPWFDKWEIVAGDSLPGKIEEAFGQSIAFVPILTRDYREGKWATQELENALAKRVAEDFRIVPVLYEDCAIPELLKATVHVDCRDHSQAAFEAQMRALIDGIYRLVRNPYR